MKYKTRGRDSNQKRALRSKGVLGAPDVVDLKAREKFLFERKNTGFDLAVHLAYPNQYWVAMSNLGFQAVYGIFARTAGVAIERAFLPDDFEQPAVATRSWRTFESAKIIADCDLLGFSLSFETDYPHLLKILANQNLLYSSAQERFTQASSSKFNFPLLVAGGTAVTLNPEPIADFVDLVVLGEAEELIQEMSEVLIDAKSRGVDRSKVLERLAELEGIYVPSFYEPIYLDLGKNNVQNLPAARASRRFVKDLSKFPTATQILTPETEFSSMYLTETGRGCEIGCRFCVAGYIYRPVRKRSEETIAQSVQIGLENSNAVGFVGAAVSSHRSISKLASAVAQRGARASLSSIMSQRVTKELAASLSESEYKTVALAPEAGTERLRFACGKRVSNAQIIEAARTLAAAGIKGFKLYFIVGLPTETDQDVMGIGLLAKQVRAAVLQAAKQRAGQAWVTLSVNPFIPKACTPFQWEPMLERRELQRKLDMVLAEVKGVSSLEMKFESPRESYFQALLSRGDRKVAKLLYFLEQNGLDWKYLVQHSSEALLPDVPPADFYVLGRIPFEQALPWDVVDSRISKELLKREALRAWQAAEPQGTDSQLEAQVSL